MNTKLSGAAFALGNLLFLANKFDEMSRLWLGRWVPDVISGQNAGLILLGQALLILGYAGLYRRFAPQVTRAGLYALRTACAGGVLLAVGHLGFISSLPKQAGALFALVLLGLPLLVFGLIGFGVANLRRPVPRHWVWLPVFTGVVGGIGFFATSGEETRAVFLVFRTLFAVGLVGIGLGLFWDSARQPRLAGGADA